MIHLKIKSIVDYCNVRYCWGCRREELYAMSIDDVEDTGSQLVITIPHSKTNIRRLFSVINEANGINFLEMFRKYTALRPKNFKEFFLFLGYRRGKCIAQRVGIHSIGGTPKKIAQFLKLKNSDKYTGHCFRRTSATFLANAGADLTVLKRHGNWKSSSVAEKYVEDSVEGKVKIARMIQGGENFVEVLQKEKTKISTSVSADSPGITVSGNSQCKITVNICK